MPAPRLATMRALRYGHPNAGAQQIINHAEGPELAMLVNAVPFTDPELLTGLAATLGNGQTQAAEPAALVVHQQVQKLSEGKKPRSSEGAPANGTSL